MFISGLSVSSLTHVQTTTKFSFSSFHSSSSSASALVSPTTVPIRVDPRLSEEVFLCGWQSETGFICGGPVSSSTCLEHLATVHGMRNMVSTLMVKCGWCSDRRLMKRENIVRHIREVHLRVRRRGSRTTASEPYRFVLVFCLLAICERLVHQDKANRPYRVVENGFIAQCIGGLLQHYCC